MKRPTEVQRHLGWPNPSQGDDPWLRLLVFYQTQHVMKCSLPWRNPAQTSSISKRRSIGSPTIGMVANGRTSTPHSRHRHTGQGLSESCCPDEAMDCYDTLMSSFVNGGSR